MSTLTLQRLNMDNSWLVQLSGLRLLVDPWLLGPEVDYFRWFNTQWHRTPPVPRDQWPNYDLVLLTQKYPDHCHPETLAALQPATVIATHHVAERARALVPSARVHALSSEQPYVHSDGTQIHLLGTTRRRDPIYEGVLIDDGHQSVLFAPHGLTLTESHRRVLAQSSPVQVLIAPFDRYELPALLGGTIKPGLETLRALVEATEARAVVRTHDEDKHARGLVQRLARITPFEPSDLAQHAWLASRYQPLPDYTPHAWPPVPASPDTAGA